ncbi:adenylate/guanylate cyclase domain-containing protein [Mycolicibacterium xanthum]|uniref:adenylate/guanylate cyclase domain-containing protein n=1 Tax=Mycolicibacterium xanthum TaxID=2796469 RepID=UPI0027E0A7FA|nr:adenylate/guanylate cyclase domain-containing protein [Mycolicibacterium xanthum]
MTDGSADPGEIRRVSLFFADLVDSTALSTRVEPETYRLVVGRYREQVSAIVAAHDGYVDSTKGDGMLAVFGGPVEPEDDVVRAVKAGLEITRAVSRLGDQTARRFGFGVDVRVGVHHGPVYLDRVHGDIYGATVSVATRISGLATPGAVVVSDAVEAVIRDDFDVQEGASATVDSVRESITYYRVLRESETDA